MGCEAREADSLVQILCRPGRSRLHARRAGLANSLVHFQACLYISREMVPVRKYDAQGRRVFNCLASPLRLMWHHGVGGVAEHTSVTFVPCL